MFSAERLAQLPLETLATGLPGAAGVLRRCGIAASAAPDRPLAEAAAERALALPPILGALEDLAESARAARGWPTEELIAHILGRYHGGHRADLALLRALAADMAERGESGDPEALDRLASLIDAMNLAMEEHMLKEELRVFPLMLRGGCARLDEWIALLRREHEDIAPFLLRLEAVTEGFRPPGPDAQQIRLYGELERFAEEMVAHVFLEEQVLFGRFLI